MWDGRPVVALFEEDPGAGPVFLGVLFGPVGCPVRRALTALDAATRVARRAGEPWPAGALARLAVLGYETIEAAVWCAPPVAPPKMEVDG